MFNFQAFYFIFLNVLVSASFQLKVLNSYIDELIIALFLFLLKGSFLPLNAILEFRGLLCIFASFDNVFVNIYLKFYN